jgi:hypothetical protein
MLIYFYKSEKKLKIMNKEENLNQVEQIFKLQTELTELKGKQEQFTEQKNKYWELGATNSKLRIVIKELD